jgi:hypothetical protein
MNIDAQTVTSIGSLIVSIIALFPRNPRDLSKEQRDALAAVSDAYHTTGKYIEYCETNPKDREREWEIAHKWDHAAKLLLPFDQEGKIWHRLDLKSRFWSDGADWDDHKVQSANIGLSTVWRDVQILLNEVA